MDRGTTLGAERIRQAEDESPKLRARDLADKLGISEAALVAARCGEGTLRIDPHPDGIMAAVARMGEVMALTRNDHCVHEKVGRYEDYRLGDHAAMVLGPEIDLRIFPSHWRHAFAVERPGEDGPRRSVQVFDAAGDAVHKIHLRAGSEEGGWEAALALVHADQSPELAAEPRPAPDAPRADPARAETLRAEWARMTDTHQFMRLTGKLKMNRLGAYRIAGAPLARPLAPDVAPRLLEAVRDAGIGVMVFVGNRGCIQIHSGPIGTVTPMGPWQNVMDPRFNLHLRADRVAEVWAVDKPTKRGGALSVEMFAADGTLVAQVFGMGAEGRDDRPAFRALVDALPAPAEGAPA